MMGYIQNTETGETERKTGTNGEQGLEVAARVGRRIPAIVVPPLECRGCIGRDQIISSLAARVTEQDRLLFEMQNEQAATVGEQVAA